MIAHDPRQSPIKFENYDRLIRMCAHKAHMRLKAAGCSTMFDDVYQEMCMTFVKAQRNFDPSKGNAFSTFLVRACWHNINRWAKGEFAHVAASLDSVVGDEDDREHHELIADGAPTIEDELMAREIRAKRLAKLTPLARKFVDLLENPPPALVRELKALQARCELGRSRGIAGARAPSSISPAFVMDVMGLSRGQRNRVYAELERLTNMAVAA